MMALETVPMGLFGRFLPLVFIVTLFFIVCDALFSFANLQNLKRDDGWVDHTKTVIVEIEQTFSLLKTTESGVRGYFLTGDSKHLVTYNIFQRTSAKQLEDLNKLTLDNPKQQKNLRELIRLIATRQTLFDQSIAQYKRDGLDGVLQSPQLDQEFRTTTQIRDLTNAMEAEEQSLLKDREKNISVAYGRITSSITIAALLNMFLITLASFLIMQELRRRRNLERRKDEFISLASHELKTPLTSQRMYIQLLRKEVEKRKNTSLLLYIKKVDEQAHRMTKLITELLDISRIQAGKLTFKKDYFDMNELIKDTVESIQGTTRKHTLQLTTTIKSDVYADRYRLYQVLVNLLANAIKYSPNGGIIQIVGQEKNRKLLVTIKDQGIGIAKEHQEHIFERLYQVSEPGLPPHPGLGIGLYISKEIVEHHDGKIWVESQKGKGSTFFIELPIQDGAPSRSFSSQTHKTPNSRKPKKRREVSRQ